jgi:hypothetical protein
MIILIHEIFIFEIDKIMEYFSRKSNKHRIWILFSKTKRWNEKIRYMMEKLKYHEKNILFCNLKV